MLSNCTRPTLALQARDYVLHLLQEDERVVFEDHLAGCPVCAERVNCLADSLSRLEHDAVRERKSVADWGFGRWTEAALAAAVVLLLLGYPAFLGLYRLPQVERQARDWESRERQARSEFDGKMRDLQIRTRSEIEERWSSSVLKGLLDVHHLSRPSRGEATADIVPLEGNEVLIYLGVQMEPADVSAGGTYRFEIRDTGGKLVWSCELSSEQVKKSLRSFEEILIPVAAESLSAGDYELRVTLANISHPEEVLVQRFSLTR